MAKLVVFYGFLWWFGLGHSDVDSSWAAKLLGSLEVCSSPSVFMCDSMCSLMQSTERACDFCAGRGRGPRTTRSCCGAMDIYNTMLHMLRSHSQSCIQTKSGRSAFHPVNTNTQRIDIPISCACSIPRYSKCEMSTNVLGDTRAAIQGFNQ